MENKRIGLNIMFGIILGLLTIVMVYMGFMLFPVVLGDTAELVVGIIVLIPLFIIADIAGFIISVIFLIVAIKTRCKWAIIAYSIVAGLFVLYIILMFILIKAKNNSNEA